MAGDGHLSRREWLAATAIGAAGIHLAARASAETTVAATNTSPFRVCLNMSTIRGQKLSVDKQIDVAAKGGYSGIEPWIGELRAFVEGGGKLTDLKKQLDDNNLTVESAIGFARWIVDDEGQRQAGLEELKRDMEMIRTLGGTRVAAPPIGAHEASAPVMDLRVVAERYRAALEVGAAMGVVPMAEVWGFSKNMSRLGETLFVMVESGHPLACMLPDFYHIYRGGSSFEGLNLLSQNAIHVFHINDYPARERTSLSDGDRVYPGDGECPIVPILKGLRANGIRCALSLELFNKDLWAKDAYEVAKAGADKVKAIIAQAMQNG
ncbi:MAG: sugar phosphate isomerase/epimerase [Planctomycetota bacterium]|nr:MAG: sugar phosphate isomerase/epimerase [Planctomycetota bacterium]